MGGLPCGIVNRAPTEQDASATRSARGIICQSLIEQCDGSAFLICCAAEHEDNNVLRSTRRQTSPKEEFRNDLCVRAFSSPSRNG